MGVGTSKSENQIIEKPIINFGSIYPDDTGKTRPGYYFSSGKIIYKGKQLEILPGEQEFQKLKYGYLKSNRRVFYKGTTIPFANPATFNVITRNNTTTLSKYPHKNNEFGKLNTVLGMDFIGNKKRIYLKDRIIYEE
jgi:hypothetical protein